MSWTKRSLAELDQILEDILERNPDFTTELNKIINPNQTQIQELRMKFSELESLVEDYVVARYSPSRQAVTFGCDCGCGGDQYTRESWDAEERFAQETIDKVKAWCHTMGIHYDGVE